MPSKIPWLRVLVEGLVIVGSILLAFGIQAWWDQSQEREEETRLLQAVLEDMRANLDAIATASDYHEAVQTTERRILALAGPEGADLTAVAADSLLADLTWVYGSDHWRSGALEAISATGLDVVQNEELRHTLASWIRIIDGVRTFEDFEEQFYDTAMMPFLTEVAVLPQIAEVAQVLPGSDFAPGYGRVNWNEERRDHRPVLLSPEFQNLVLQRLWIRVVSFSDTSRSQRSSGS